MKILVINGPNMNFLGIREPGIYGSETYEDLVHFLKNHAKARGVEVDFFQSNHEGALIDRIQEAYYEKVDGIVLNPASYTHTSIALMDTIKTVRIPTVEVHISDLSKREDFRKTSYVRLAAVKTIAGHGFQSYSMAMDYLIDGEKK